MIEKEFGKYSIDELQKILEIIQTFISQKPELLSAIQKDEKGFVEDLPTGFRWADVYCHSFIGHASLALYYAGAGQEPAKAAASENPQAYALNELPKFAVNVLEPEGSTLTGEQNLGAIFLALFRSLDSMLLYGKSLSRLVAEAEGGNMDSLFKAVSIDHSIVSNAVIAGYITVAEMRDDHDFFDGLTKALSKRPKKANIDHGPLRYLLALLSEEGVLETLSEEARYKLFCIDLAVYDPDNELQDAAGSLKKFIQRWKKDQETSISDFMSSTF